MNLHIINHGLKMRWEGSVCHRKVRSNLADIRQKTRCATRLHCDLRAIIKIDRKFDCDFVVGVVLNMEH
jgi:hypothetical protein